MARSVFFSLHYQRDVWRVNQVKNVPAVLGVAAAGFRDAGPWEEAKQKGDAAIKRLIDNGLVGTSVTVVCIGRETASRRYVDYEIQKSIDVGNGIFGLRIHMLQDHSQRTDFPGPVPDRLLRGNYPVMDYSGPQALSDAIERAAYRAGR